MHKDELYNQLKMKIFNEEIPPGTWLVEREISEKYNVSRTPVREILRVLAADGLIIFEPTKGYSVRKLGFDEIVEIFNARESLEGMASRLACIRGDQDFFSNIKKIRKQLEQVDVKKDPSLGVEIGHTLHNAIVKEANNKILSALTRNLTKRSVEIELNSQKDHIAIADAILEKDEDKSEQAMRKHIKSTCLLLTQYHLMEQTGLVSNLNTKTNLER
jgi:DNA-binding GntR family transcriptional regulator